MQSFDLRGSTHPLLVVLSAELFSNPPQPRVSKLAVRGLSASEVLVQPWRQPQHGPAASAVMGEVSLDRRASSPAALHTTGQQSLAFGHHPAGVPVS